MKKIQQATLPLKECLICPRYNYRDITKEDEPDLLAFSERLIKEGQLTAIRIAKLSVNALKNKILKDLCGEGDSILLDGERRLLGMELAQKKDAKHFKTVKIEFISVNTLKEYLALQMTYNMDRKNTSFTEDGIGFKRYLKGGGKKVDLLTSINFPEGVLTKTGKLKYITDRIELLSLHSDLYPYLNKGIIRPFKKTHQGYLILKFAPLLQQKLAKEYAQIQRPKSNAEIIGFFNQSRTSFVNVPFDTEDERLGIKEFGTKSCTGCPYLIATTEEEFFGDGGSDQMYCYHAECFKAKRSKQIETLTARLTEDKVEFVLLAEPTNQGFNRKAEEVLESGLKLIRYYKVVPKGSCSHAIAGIPDGNSESASLEKGKVHFVCPKKSKCTIHFPEVVEEKVVKRKERITIEKTQVKKETQLQTAIEWATQVLAGDTAKVDDELLILYIQHSFGPMLRFAGSDAQKTFRVLIGETKEQPFITATFKHIVASIKVYGYEKTWKALLLAHLFHDFNQHWKLIEKLGGKLGIDFTQMLKDNTKEQLQELNTKHKKRKEGWNKEEAGLQKKIHALYFDLSYKFGICDWQLDEKLLAVLKDEVQGKKVCRLVGISLKGVEYVPNQILQKLKGKKSELDKRFPDFKLMEMEEQFLKAHQALVENKAAEKLMSETIEFGVGLPFDFIRKCITKAGREGNHIATSEFLAATIEDGVVTLLLFSSEANSIIKKVTKEESLTGYYKLKKDRRQIIFNKLPESV